MLLKFVNIDWPTLKMKMSTHQLVSSLPYVTTQIILNMSKSMNKSEKHWLANAY